MEKDVFVTYTKDGKELIELFQEWINENMDDILNFSKTTSN
ncbi:MAG: hypothetical protein ACLSW4_06530 [Clostridia bacterium]